ncbi:MAG: riboflavin synthase [Haloarculaceae archaeon]
MFTGIVEETGEVLAVEDDADGRRLLIATSFEELAVGQSMSVSGACLTVEDSGDRTAEGDAGGGDRERPRWFALFLAAETVDRTYLGTIEVGDAVNLERAVPADGRFDGHVVQGHVDGTAEVTSIEQVGDDWRYGVSLPSELAPYVVEKGSITIDGISLTVADLDDEGFEVAIVPETYEVTTLSETDPGDPVHLEVDVIAKYVESLVDGYL